MGGPAAGRVARFDVTLTRLPPSAGKSNALRQPAAVNARGYNSAASLFTILSTTRPTVPRLSALILSIVSASVCQ